MKISTLIARGLRASTVAVSYGRSPAKFIHNPQDVQGCGNRGSFDAHIIASLHALLDEQLRLQLTGASQ